MMKMLCVLYSLSLSKVMLIISVIPYHLLPFILFTILLRSIIKLSIGMTTEMFTKESINSKWSLMN